MARGSTAPEAVLEGAEVGGAGHVRNDAVRRGWAGTRQVRREGPAACGCAGGRPSLGVAVKTSLFCTVTARVRAPGGGRAGPGWRDAVKGEPHWPLLQRAAEPPACHPAPSHAVALSVQLASSG